MALIFALISLFGLQAPVAAQEAAVAVAPPRFSVPASDEGLPGAGPIHRDEWFQQTWNDRRSGFADRAEAERRALVFLGDSITQGWGDDFGGRFPDVKAANRGISGDTSRGLLLRVDDDVLSLDPAGVVLLIGTNDIELGAEPATIAVNIKALLDKLSDHDPKAPVILCQVFPSAASMKRPADKIRELNRYLATIVRGREQVTLVDTFTLFANADGDAKPEEMPDLLHLNEAGYAKWRAGLWPLLAAHGFVETEPDDFQPEEGFELLFNGRDLTGWGYRPTSDGTRKQIADWKRRDPNMPPWPIVDEAVSFDGQPASSDGRYVARNGRLVVLTPTEGRRIQELSTMREFSGDFTLKLEFRAAPNADSGVFVCGRQLQCRDYGLAGPYKGLKNYKPQDWNEIVVTVKDNVAHCTCNGEVLEAAYELPKEGPIGLEGDRGQMEYRRIRIRPSP